MKKNGFLTFVFACVPGFGQMYQGYMRRGVSLAFWFWAIIGVVSLSHVNVLGILLPVVWAYSFFDTFNIRALTPQQRAAFGDNYLPNPASLGKNGAEGAPKPRAAKVFGWLLVAVGLLVLYNNFWDTFYWNIFERFPALANWLNRLPAVVIGVAVIVLGVLMLRGRKAPPPEDDLQGFSGGEQP